MVSFTVRLRLTLIRYSSLLFPAHPGGWTFPASSLPVLRIVDVPRLFYAHLFGLVRTCWFSKWFLHLVYAAFWLTGLRWWLRSPRCRCLLGVLVFTCVPHYRCPSGGVTSFYWVDSTYGLFCTIGSSLRSVLPFRDAGRPVHLCAACVAALVHTLPASDG